MVMQVTMRSFMQQLNVNVLYTYKISNHYRYKQKYSYDY